jgi:hypothetical protein
VSDPVTYTAVLPVDEETVPFVSRLLPAEQRRRRTRRRRRALGCYRQAVLMLRWFLDGTRLAQLAADNRIGRSTADDIATRIIQPVTRPSARRIAPPDPVDLALRTIFLRRQNEFIDVFLQRLADR